MSMTDPVADFLTRLRNAAKAQHQDVTIPSSKLKQELARILKEQGYIDAYAVHAAAAERPGQEITIT
ncbi:MAG TPA: 30S ribosomal protein S8, partial [bacterium]|nr:30S ribosomal protein S8 [bacterium]